MADDGMLLNFSIDEGIINPSQQKFKGGNWKDRLVARKIAAHQQRKAKSGDDGNADGNNNSAGAGDKRHVQNPNRVELGARPAKRQKVEEGGFRPASSKSAAEGGGRGGGGGQQQQGGPRGPGQQRQVISSLFSFNPAAKTADDVPAKGEEGEDMETVKASNAALVDGIDTFTSLGLAPTLAAHLLTKLELKAPTAIQKSAITQLLKEACDAFIQAETGSGKTLAYLLPLVQRLINMKSNVHRDSGLFAIVLAPTRELCKQISVVLESLLRCAHWIVAGTVIGGEKKKSEKARLRKGLNVLVATPGRLADHLENTEVLDVSKVRWLVLDEGDRLMDLGFDEEIQGIIKTLDARKRPFDLPGLPETRTTVLCSATMKMTVQRLGEISLKDAIHVKADPEDEDENVAATEKMEFSAPAQLKQAYVVVPSKLRLVSLTAMLKKTFARKGSVMKAIVFVSCADSVDFHFELFTRALKKEDDEESSSDKEDEAKAAAEALTSEHRTIAKGTAFSNPSNSVTLHRLHGSLPQHVRTATLNAFARQKNASVLICTDVAARGLDLPDVDFVVEYDPAFSADDHLHRIGRTARLGRDGRALIFLLPGPEEGYVEVLKGGYRDGSGKSVTRNDNDQILKRGFGGNSGGASQGWEAKATDWQLEIERWALENPVVLEMARRAYQSHIRAYATHISSERSMFNIKDLHLGHLAKSFALRDRPAKINVPGLRPGKEDTKKSFKADRKPATGEKKERRPQAASAHEDTHKNSESGDAARRMRQKIKAMMGGGASEFNIA